MKGVKHYLRDGTEWKGKTHKHPDGKVMTGAKMTKASKPLFHLKDLYDPLKGKTDNPNFLVKWITFPLYPKYLFLFLYN